MLLAELVATSKALRSTRKRKAKILRLAELLRSLAAEERVVGARFLSGEVRQGKIGIGYRAVQNTAGLDPAAESSLSLLDVDQTLQALAETSGPGSMERRKTHLHGLLLRATADEQDFLRRLLVGEVRHGALEGLLIEAVADAAELSADEVRRARMVAGDVGDVVIAALTGGEAALQRFTLTLFTPVHPMLAGTAEGIEDALNRLRNPFLEVKLDGARVQVHKRDGEVRVYSRRLNDVTAAVPEVVELVERLPARTLILDGETLAFDEAGRPLSFQTTMRRFGRRLDVERLRRELPLKTLFFDILYQDGRDLLAASTERRREILAASVPDAHRVPSERIADLDAADGFLARALALGHEGVMAKSADAPYEAGHRGANWLKVKPVHTLDLVVIAAEWGSGRRTGWLSNLHLAARDPEHDSYVMLGKTFKGLTDERLAWQTEALLSVERSREGHIVHVDPRWVVEIAFDGLQQSSQYPGGLALRFARVRGYRPDKSAADADSMETVRRLVGQRPAT